MRKFDMKLELHLQAIMEAMEGIHNDISSAYEVLENAVMCERTIWALGNGGSMAIAQHFAQDLIKLGSIRASAINCPSIFSAYSNDDGFENSFFNPLKILAWDEEPIVIFSCSGKSRNYSKFFTEVQEKKHPIISVVGTDGGFLKEKSDVCIHIKSDDYQVCETAFSVVSDILIKALKDKKED